MLLFQVLCKQSYYKLLRQCRGITLLLQYHSLKSVKIHIQGNARFCIQQLKWHSVLAFACFCIVCQSRFTIMLKLLSIFSSQLPLPLFPRQHLIQNSYYLCISIQYYHISLIFCVDLLAYTSICLGMAWKSATPACFPDA